MIQFSPIECTRENLNMLWQKVSELAAWSMDDNSTSHGLAVMLASEANKYFWIWEGNEIVGYCSLTGIDGRTANAHVLFFDRRVVGRGARLNRFAYKVMEDLGLTVLRSITPATHKASIAMLEHMDWHRDGIIRQYIMRDGQPIDGILFSITKEEFDGRYVREEKGQESQSEKQTARANNDDSRATPPLPHRENDAGGRETPDIHGVPGHGADAGNGTAPEPAIPGDGEAPETIPRITENGFSWRATGFLVTDAKSLPA